MALKNRARVVSGGGLREYSEACQAVLISSLWWDFMGVSLSAFIFAVLAGCTDKGTVPPLLDVDEDGFYSDVDCNDLDPLINPAAAELCDEIDNDCDGEADEDDAVEAVLWFPDNDGDGYGDSLGPIGGCVGPSGYVDNADDCDDEDADRNPGNVEVCDELDNDCDGLQDEDSAADVQTLYRDYDGDGYGNPYITVRQCFADEDYVDNDADCDDADPSIYPGAEEICDPDGLALDNDCDGDIDDDDTSRVGGTDWYYDGDGDGYGTPDITTAACLVPDGHVADSSDCDDAQITVNPEAEEVCGDGIDNNCDTLIDTEDPDARPVAWYADTDGDGYGDPDAYWGEGCDVPPGLVANNDDCDDGDIAVNPSAAEIWYDGQDSDCAGDDDFDADADGSVAEDFGGDDCNDADADISALALEICGDGVDNDCDTVEDECALSALLLGDVDGDEAGVSLLAPGDLDGDGQDDVLVGTPYHDAAGVGSGAVYLYTGLLSGTVELSDGLRIDGEDVDDVAGWTLAAPGDADGDGYDDVLIGAYRADASASEVGGAYLVAGPLTADASLADAAASFLGEASGDAAGWTLDGGGDYDGDGVSDLLIGAVDEGSVATGAGAVYLVSGPLTSTTRLWSAELKLTGESGGDAAGTAAIFAGDLNGDGAQELAVGAPNHDESGNYEGAVYVVSGADEGTVSLSGAAGIWIGEAGGDLVGTSLAAAGDLNSDGYADLLVGAPGHDGGGDEAGAAYVLLGPATGSHDFSAAAARLDGEGVEDFAGRAVAGLGDLNADGALDIAVGAPGHDSGGSEAGAAYLLLGPMTGTLSLADAEAVTHGEAESAALGSTILGAGDLTADGLPDVLIGAPGAEAGSVSLISGGGW